MPLAALWLGARAHAEDDLHWARAMGGVEFDVGYAIAVDSGGNVYVAGEFDGTVDFDPDPVGVFELTSAGGFDIFVTKLDVAGKFVWAKAIGNTGLDQAWGIALDSAGNVHVTGLFEATVDFDPDPVGEFNLTSGGDLDIFVVKLDTDGGFVWARAMGGAGVTDQGYAIAVDSAGSVYTTGRFEDTADFDPDPVDEFELTAAGFVDMFVSKLDANGDFVWAKAMGGTGALAEGFSIALDAPGNVYTTGYFEGTVDFDPDSVGEFELTAPGILDIFVAKLDTNGAFVWAKAMGGPGVADQGHAITVDSAGSVYTTGRFEDTVDFDPDPVGEFELTAAGIADIFVVKLDTDGAFLWAKAMGAVTGSGEGWGIAVNEEGEVHLTGLFDGVVDFNPGPGVYELGAVDGSDIFILELDTEGAFIWARAMGGGGSDAANAIAVDDAGTLHVTGYFSLTADLNPGPGMLDLSSVAFSADVCVVKYQGPVVQAFSGTLIDGSTLFPLACAAVDLISSDTLLRIGTATDESGRFFLESVPDDLYTLRVIAPGFTTLHPAPVLLEGGSPVKMDFYLTPSPAANTVGGSVTDAASGRPLVAALVELYIDSAFVADTRTCLDGRYELPLPAGDKAESLDIELRFSLANYEPVTVFETVNPAEGALINAGLAKSVVGIYALAGRVDGLSGWTQGPLPGATVRLRKDGLDQTATVTDQDGLFFFDGLDEGDYTLLAGKAGYASHPGVQRKLAGPVLVVEAIIVLSSETPAQPPVDPPPADINADGKVDAVDIQLVINAAIRVPINPAFDADVNSDGSVNALDVQHVINVFLGRV